MDNAKLIGEVQKNAIEKIRVNLQSYKGKRFIDARIYYIKTKRGIEMKEFVEFIVKKLVDNPEKVSVTEVEGERITILELRVERGDMGKVIGKKGQTAQSIRTLLGAASAKLGKRAVLEILE